MRKVVESAAHFSRIALRASRYGCVRCANLMSSALLSARGLSPAVSAAAAAGSPICEHAHESTLNDAMCSCDMYLGWSRLADAGAALASVPSIIPRTDAIAMLTPCCTHLVGADTNIGAAVAAAPRTQAVLPRCVHHGGC